MSSFEQLVSLLPGFPVSDFWIVKKLENAILFLHVDGKSGHPEVEQSGVAVSSVGFSGSVEVLSALLTF